MVHTVIIISLVPRHLRLMDTKPLRKFALRQCAHDSQGNENLADVLEAGQLLLVPAAQALVALDLFLELRAKCEQGRHATADFCLRQIELFQLSLLGFQMALALAQATCASTYSVSVRIIFSSIDILKTP